MKILLAVDDSPHSNYATESVAARPWPADALMRVLSIAPNLVQPGVDIYYGLAIQYEETLAQLHRNAEALVKRTADLLRAKGLTAEERVEVGDPRVAIVDEATKWRADMIVIGSHGYTGLRRLLLGSVSNYVVNHAHCSVEIIRRPE